MLMGSSSCHIVTVIARLVFYIIEEKGEERIGGHVRKNRQNVRNILAVLEINRCPVLR
jgi:hypothetical protein